MATDRVNKFEKETKDSLINLEASLISFNKAQYSIVHEKITVKDLDREEGGLALAEVEDREIKSIQDSQPSESVGSRSGVKGQSALKNAIVNKISTPINAKAKLKLSK